MSVVDTNFVNFAKLEEDLDEDCAKELVDAFLEDTSHVITTIDEAITSKDIEALRANAHMLKGCCRSIAAVPAEHAAGALEKDAMDGNWDQVSEHFSATKILYEQTADAIKKYLGR